jgi:hypothetical protein
MSEFERSNLIEFLRKPRRLREIVSHFEAPVKLVNHQLQEAIESGEVLVYRKQIQKGTMKSNARQLQPDGAFYISRKSSFPAEDLAATNSLPKTKNSSAKESVHLNHKDSVFSSRKPVFMRSFMTSLKLGKIELSGALNNLSNKMKVARSNRSAEGPRRKRIYDSSEPRSLSYVEKICLFRGLQDQPLPFLDIHKRFGVSKGIVKGFVKRGVFAEVWGPNNVGVKYRLTEKGEANLKELEKASYFERQQRRKIFINLKQRIPS